MIGLFARGVIFVAQGGGRVDVGAGGSLTFGQAALSAFVVLMTFNAVDLTLLDWLLVERLLPGRIVIPGAPGLRFTTGDAHHFRGFLVGTGLSLAAVGVIGGVAALLW